MLHPRDVSDSSTSILNSCKFVLDLGVLILNTSSSDSSFIKHMKHSKKSAVTFFLLLKQQMPSAGDVFTSLPVKLWLKSYSYVNIFAKLNTHLC